MPQNPETRKKKNQITQTAFTELPLKKYCEGRFNFTKAALLQFVL
jgi:hypothetical protein